MEIVYTKTDEAPALATESFLPVVEAFLGKAGIKVSLKDISLGARILAQFPEKLEATQKVNDALSELGKLVLEKNANIIKLPNISASVAQLKSAIKELQEKGFNIPDYPETLSTDSEKEILARYSKVLGSAVNPVLREGNSDRRVAKPVKEYAKKNPHRMGTWNPDSKTRVSSMEKSDFFDNEKSLILSKDSTLKIVFESNAGEKLVLKDNISLEKGDVVDGSFLSVSELKNFFQKQFEIAQKESLLLSLHMKATMMKVSDPIIFGHAVKCFYSDAFENHAQLLKDINANPNLGLADVIGKLEKHNSEEAKECLQKIAAKNAHEQLSLAMVNSDKGISNLHFPNDVIIDASMPAMIREGGKMWNREGETQDTLALIPDRSYSAVYQKTVEFCKKNGALQVSKLGSVANVGLMAKKAEEYGSHDKTFEMKEDGKMLVLDHNKELLMSHEVEQGDIWRLCTTKNVAIQDWIQLSLKRAELTQTPVIFWLNQERPHDKNLEKKLEDYFSRKPPEKNVQWSVLAPAEATEKSLNYISQGEDVIAASGNVLRDYLTDLFPILELGTSAKMLSIVPLLNGGALFETGAGGSAPKHVQQLVEENHLRWDSLGEFLALAVSLDDLAEKTKSSLIAHFAEALDRANFKYLNENKAPSRKVGELDNRGTHFYVAKFWAEELNQINTLDPSLKNKVQNFSKLLETQEENILKELSDVQGKPVDLDGYYWPCPEKASSAMRPSKTFNKLVTEFCDS